MGVDSWRVNSLRRLPNALRSIFGLQSDDLPRELLTPGIVPAVDVYQPALICKVGTTPAAGVAPAVLTVPRDPPVMWELLAAFVRIVADANVANRDVLFEVQVPPPDEPTSLVRIALAGSGTATTASQTQNYTAGEVGTFGQTAAVVAANEGAFVVPLPRLWLPPGSTIGILVTNIQVGDQLTALRALVREWAA